MRVSEEEVGLISLSNILQSFRYWPRIARLLWHTNGKFLLAIVALNIFGGFSPIVVLLLTQRLLNRITDSWTNGFEVIIWAFVMLAAFTFLSEVLNMLQSYVSKLFETLLMKYVNRLIMEKSVSLSLRDFENPYVQDALKLAQNEAGHRPYQIMQQMLSLLSNIVTLISAIGMLIAFKWWMAFLLLVMPLTSFYSYLRIGQEEFLLHFRRVPKLRQSWYLSYLMTNDKNFKEVKLYQLGKYLLHRYSGFYEEFYKEDSKMMKKRLHTGIAFQVINYTAYIVMMLVVLGAAFWREIQIGNVVALIQTITMTQSTSQALITGILALCQHNLYLQQLFSFLDLPVREQLLEKRGILNRIEQIEFQNVSFRYPDNAKDTLCDVSFTLRRGETIAIVGRNGSGKTTLVKLLTQLYDDFEGEILINGISIRSYEQEELRRHMGVVFQDFVQYELKMRHNIGFGNVEQLEQDEELQEAAQQAGIDALIKELPKGLNTQVGRQFEQGHQLSGGQWQRVAIARAFMRKADLYVFDEPSSMLDPESEMQVFEKFKKLIHDRIGIFISHRYTSIKYADRILMMDQGIIAEQGSHQELMELDGMYAYLYRMQVAAYKQT